MTRTLVPVAVRGHLAVLVLAGLAGLIGLGLIGAPARAAASSPAPRVARVAARRSTVRRHPRHRRRRPGPVVTRPAPGPAAGAPAGTAVSPTASTVSSAPAPGAPGDRPIPIVTTGVPTAVTDSGAVVSGTIRPAGSAPYAWFEWGTSPRYGERGPMPPLRGAAAAGAVSLTLSNLAPATTYHVRLVVGGCARCAGGIAVGQDMAFVTRGYENPVYSLSEAADPSVLDTGGAHDSYWAFLTGDRFPILHSGDLVHWSDAGAALAQRPAWATQASDWHPWAPNVIQTDGPCPGATAGGCYVMYYVALSAATRANCVAVATATAPGGPYTDQGPLSNGTLDAQGRPVGCGDNAGYGQIDPSAFVDPASGARYLYVSEDFACPSGSPACTAANSALRPTLSVIPLSADGLSATGPRTPLLSGMAGSWEAAGASVPTVEGPTALEHDGTYYLLYSGGSWHSQYAMGYATASSPLGPFTRGSAHPILSSSPDVIGPGGGDTPVVGPNGGQWLVYHGRAGWDAATRVLRIDPFSWTPAAGAGPDIPTVGGPTSGPQSIAP